MRDLFVDTSDPERMVETAIDLFGNEAATAVAHCGLEAWTEVAKTNLRSGWTFSIV